MANGTTNVRQSGANGASSDGTSSTDTVMDPMHDYSVVQLMEMDMGMETGNGRGYVDTRNDVDNSNGNSGRGEYLGASITDALDRNFECDDGGRQV